MSQSFDVELIPRVQSVEKKMRFQRIEKHQERGHEGKGRHYEERKQNQQAAPTEGGEGHGKIDITV